jgi:hypothetical protein
MRRDRGHAQDSDRNPSWSVLQITLPAFVVRILQRRAQNRELSVSAVVEESILDGIMLDEVQRMAELSPDFARVAKTWIRSEVAKGKRADHV